MSETETGAGDSQLITVTLDTNVLNDAVVHQVETAAAAKGIVMDVRTTTVNRREKPDPPPMGTVMVSGIWGSEAVAGRFVFAASPVVREGLVIGETVLGDGALAESTRLEAILDVLSNGSFPQPGLRTGLTPGQRRQLRDAMTLDAHARECRDVFITNDRRGFVNEGRRQKLEALCATRIVTPNEVGVTWP